MTVCNGKIMSIGAVKVMSSVKLNCAMCINLIFDTFHRYRAKFAKSTSYHTSPKDEKSQRTVYVGWNFMLCLDIKDT